MHLQFHFNCNPNRTSGRNSDERAGKFSFHKTGFSVASIVNESHVAIEIGRIPRQWDDKKFIGSKRIRVSTGDKWSLSKGFDSADRVGQPASERRSLRALPSAAATNAAPAPTCARVTTNSKYVYRFSVEVTTFVSVLFMCV